MLRVRDEIRMTIACYQTLYESSIAFGMRTALQAEQRKVEMQAKIKVLDSDKRELQKQVNDMKEKCKDLERREKERRDDDGQKHKDEIEYLKKHNQSLKKELEQLLAIPSTAL